MDDSSLCIYEYIIVRTTNSELILLLSLWLLGGQIELAGKANRILLAAGSVPSADSNFSMKGESG